MIRTLAILGALGAAVALYQARSQPAEGPDEVAASGLVAAEPSFVDEFDSPESLRRWGHVFDDPGKRNYPVPKRTLYTNGERQIFVDPQYLGLGIDPFRVEDGVLTITAAPLDARARAAIMAELDTQPDHRTNRVLRALAYSSGQISQRGRFAQRYGYFEARMRWTGGKGIWPAFWLLRQDSRWPPEIDVIEALGHDDQTIYSSVHSNAEPRHITRKVPLQGSPRDFHLYGALWLPDRVDFYVDRRKTVSIPTKPDMNLPMYPLVTLAIGGDWPGDPDASTEMPARLEIDYIKVWPLSPAMARTLPPDASD